MFRNPPYFSRQLGMIGWEILEYKMRNISLRSNVPVWNDEWLFWYDETKWLVLSEVTTYRSSHKRNNHTH